MPEPTAMLFVDGENLLAGFEAMKKSGWEPMSQLSYGPKDFVWSTEITRFKFVDIVRASYYTTHVGSDETLRDLEKEIAKIVWRCDRANSSGGMIPHVFKKPSQQQKTASVDINIAIDVLRHCYQKDVDAVILISGDGDYIPLVKEAMRTGTRVYVGALSNGRHPVLPVVCDGFWDLDQHFFKGRPEAA